MLSFSKFRSCLEELKENTWSYLGFMLMEGSLPVSQPVEKETWGKIKAGFDAAKDPHVRIGLAKAGRQIRGNRRLFGAEGSNPKLAKESENVPTYLTKGLSLSPADESGRLNFCACATPECRAACLNKKGRGAMTSVQKARLIKTDFVIDHSAHFMSMLHHETNLHEINATKKGKKAAVRLNVFSDVPYEILHPEIFSEHKGVQFYDYTKISARVLNPDGSRKALPENYHLTLSSSGIHEKGNWDDVRQHLSNGGVAAMVFGVRAGTKNRPGDALPTHVYDEKTGKRWRVIDGDVHDHRHLDHVYSDAEPEEGLIAGLRIKGGKKAMAEAKDFAVDVAPGQTTITVPDMKRVPEYYKPELAQKRTERPF